jgi:hypothetical protein
MRRRIPLLPIVLFAAVAGADGLKDPTRPPAPVVPAARAAAQITLPRVSAVFISSTRRVAIFNDQPVHVGDHIGIYLIREINADGVRYTASGHTAYAPLAASP